MDRPAFRPACSARGNALPGRGGCQCGAGRGGRTGQRTRPAAQAGAADGRRDGERDSGRIRRGAGHPGAAARPLRVIPGNHDEREAFRRAFHDHTWLPASGPLHYVDAASGPVRVIALDVTIPGLHHGEADAAALAWLEAALAEAPGRPTVVMMHQPPIECGVPYLDRYRCHGEAALAALLGRYQAVERLLCGHVHRTMLRRFGGTLLCTAPSTATAIALRPRGDARPASHLEPPGFLLHQWRPEGMLTHHLPIGDFPGPYPFA
ncbi:metallophosphoesterase [Dankookia sp. P2]|uniref:metallophosphoesterase n=1 Tax=Dankookia sp. P2 TaxID=3423955 RepID=UPI003D67B6B8